VFEPFFSTKMTVGTGLGLPTVYGTVRRWGGQCDVDSVLGEGTTIRIRFRIAEVATESATEMEEIAETHGHRVIVIDDEDGVRDVLSNLLSPDHRVDAFHSGPAALEHFTDDRYDVALIDLGMPGMAGDELARRIRALDEGIATVLLTGWELTEEDPRLCGFDFQLIKPVRAQILRDVIARSAALREKRAHET
jgi:CheY-like chemotaxis protein